MSKLTMSEHLEKRSRTRGMILSGLLHGIFIAGCLALDAGSLVTSAQPDTDQVQIRPIEPQPAQVSAKS